MLRVVVLPFTSTIYPLKSLMRCLSRKYHSVKMVTIGGAAVGRGVVMWAGLTPTSSLPQTRQWAEIQAHSRRVSLEAFLRLAEQSREELKLALQVGPAHGGGINMGRVAGGTKWAYAIM